MSVLNELVTPEVLHKGSPLMEGHCWCSISQPTTMGNGVFHRLPRARVWDPDVRFSPGVSSRAWRLDASPSPQWHATAGGVHGHWRGLPWDRTQQRPIPVALRSQESAGARVRWQSVGTRGRDEHPDVFWGVSSLSMPAVEEFELWLAWKLVLHS